jgi:8-oxo-dGTP pyrophosphatase MutT (NUDIX family)
VQVPAGTVRPGEDPAAAALRETCEETGRDCFALRHPLGVETYRISAGEEHVRHFFQLAPTGPLPETWEAAELDDGARPPTRFTLSWLPLDEAHVLAAGFGARLADVRRGY